MYRAKFMGTRVLYVLYVHATRDGFQNAGRTTKQKRRYGFVGLIMVLTDLGSLIFFFVFFFFHSVWVKSEWRAVDYCTEIIEDRAR
jgi:hypothetical protein